MEQIAVIFLVVAAGAAVVQTCFFRKAWHAVVFALVCGAAVFAFHSAAIEQNRWMLHDILSRHDVLFHAALWVIVENLLFIWADVLRLRQHTGDEPVNSRRRRIAAWATYYPGCGFFGCLFYAEVQLFLMAWDISFTALAGIIAAGTAAAILAGSCAVKRLLPAPLARMEAGYVLHLAQMILASVIAGIHEKHVIIN